MARGISDTDVFEAADQLLARGERPTIERVRQELGRGSPNTVNRHLDIWWQSLSRRVGGQVAPGLPSPLIALCQKLYDGARAEARQETEQIIEEKQRLLQQRERSLEEARSGLEAERQAVNATIETLRAELAKVLEQQKEMAEAVSALETALAVERTRSESARRETEQLQAQLQAVRRAAEREASRLMAQAEGNERRFLIEIDRARTDLKAAKTAHERDQKLAQGRYGNLEKRLAVVVTDLDEAEHKLRKLESELTREREVRIAATSELAGLRSVRHPHSRRKKADA